ncbi:iron-siderophore ABC transporter substrate-binding protein [Streptomyces sp. NPDC049954]|uniref:ABC transporter substrate-binding protein n=1 Tax=Streptomyces sp. NPDC049954 TaxID=3155779 RepID=UPI00341CE1DF
MAAARQAETRTPVRARVRAQTRTRGAVGGTSRTRGRGRTALAAALLALAALATACGSSGSAGEDGADASEKGGGPAQEASAGPAKDHVVDTAMGPVHVPARPRRVVVLDTAELDSAITLGVTPVGAVKAGAASDFLDYLPKSEVTGIKNVGEIASPNLEAVAALKPDLILTSEVRDGARYEQLKAIAPTVMTENTGYPWKQNFRVHAQALGRTAEAKRVESAYADKVAKVRTRIGGAKKAAAVSVNVVRFVEGADIRIYGDRTYIGTILKDVGLGRPPIVAKAKDGFSYDVSPERIDLADADVIFHATYGDARKSRATQVLDSGLWKKLPAYKNHRVTAVDDELWLQGIGYTAADKILDELETGVRKAKR